MMVRRVCTRIVVIASVVTLTAGCGPRTAEKPPPPDVFSHDTVVDAMARAFDWQIAHIVYEAPLPDGGFQEVSDTEWVRGAFFAGVMAAYEATGESRYLAAAMEISQRNAWLDRK